MKGSPIAFGYQAVFAPFIPLWFIGEEWNNTQGLFRDFAFRRYKYRPKRPTLYHTQILWNEIEKNRAEYLQKLKK